MADRRRRRGLPKRALIGPLLMLVSGAAAGAMLWWFLMLEPPARGPAPLGAAERLSRDDRQALQRLFEQLPGRP
jgi:hypothetical protein